MKKRTIAVSLVLALVTVLMPITGLAAGWQYSEDGSFGVVVYLPTDGQTIYNDEGFSFEFDLKRPSDVQPYYEVSLYGVGADGYPNYDNMVKTFNVGYAQNSNGRYVITLDVKDVNPGNYYLLFVLGNEDGSQFAFDIRRITVAKRDSGWQQFGSRWSYKLNGSWVTNKWQLISGKWYRFDANGYMLTNWQKIGSSWFYLGSDGAMRTGWHQIGGKWYCFNVSGAMFANVWLSYGNSWYMMDTSGAMLTGWQKDSIYWYYMSPSSGKMLTGWQQIGGKWYFLDASGKMVTGTLKIGGTTYTFNSSGVWVK